MLVASDYFQQATDVDPGYSLAWVGIADTWIARGWYSRLAPRETFPQAKQAVMRALQFDSTLAEAHASLAHIHLEYDHDWDAAEREYRRAIALNPAYPVAHHWYGGFLSAMGRHDEAMQQAQTAHGLDPLSPIIQTWIGLRHYFAGRHLAGAPGGQGQDPDGLHHRLCAGAHPPAVPAERPVRRLHPRHVHHRHDGDGCGGDDPRADGRHRR
jgi:tetratricopeptide (TPR) repeat protein